MYVHLLNNLQVKSTVLNALYSEIRNVVAAKQAYGTSASYMRIPAAPDGYCAYHCVYAALTFSEWNAIARKPNGMPVNNKLLDAESSAVAYLREHALVSTPVDDPIIAEQALEAQKTCTVDVGELSWLARSLNLAIRCTIDNQDWSWESWCVCVCVLLR